MNKDEALNLALEALENTDRSKLFELERTAITAIKEALAQPVQPKREWVELSKIEEEQCFEESSCPLAAVRNASAKLKELNT